jgi:type I restriction enzyme R subunit
VADGVVLDLRYEARNIDQDLTSPEKVDKWFEAKTRGMTDLSRAELKKRWGTMQKVVSSEPRARQIVNDILLDMETKPRLSDGRGNAILVSSSIYQACKFYELFTQAGFKSKCSIVTSYAPQAGDIAKEDSGHGATERLRQYEIYRQMLADHFNGKYSEVLWKGMPTVGVAVGDGRAGRVLFVWWCLAGAWGLCPGLEVFGAGVPGQEAFQAGA